MAALGWPYYQQTVARIEEGKRKASVGEAESLARIVGTSARRLTMPGQEASLLAILDQAIGRGLSAYEDINRRTKSLRWAQRQLTLSVSEAERANYCGSALVRDAANEARQVIALDPYVAVTDAVGEDTALIAGLKATRPWHAEAGPFAALNLGNLLAEDGDPEGAKAAYQEAIESGHAEAAAPSGGRPWPATG